MNDRKQMKFAKEALLVHADTVREYLPRLRQISFRARYEITGPNNLFVLHESPCITFLTN
jgi:hypothetical protein